MKISREQMKEIDKVFRRRLRRSNDRKKIKLIFSIIEVIPNISVPDIAGFLGVHKNRVYRVLGDFAGNAPLQEVREFLIENFDASEYDVAEYFGISVDGARVLLRRVNWGIYAQENGVDAKLFLAWVKLGNVSYVEIASKFGVSRQEIYYWRDVWGV